MYPPNRTTPREISAKSQFISNADLPGPVRRFSTPFQRNLSYCGVVSSLLASPGNTVMTYCSTYIGDLAGPSFKWNGGDWNGNIPPRISPTFPPVRMPNNYNRKFHDWVASTKVTCKQTDYGGWVARVGKAQLLDFIQYCYGSERDEAVNKFVDFVNSLEDAGQYALVAEEY